MAAAADAESLDDLFLRLEAADVMLRIDPDVTPTMAKTPTQVRDFAKQVGMPMGDFIPVWDLDFDPRDNVRVDFQNKTINTFTPSPYMKAKAVQAIANALDLLVDRAAWNL